MVAGRSTILWLRQNFALAGGLDVPGPQDPPPNRSAPRSKLPQIQDIGTAGHRTAVERALLLVFV